MTTARSGRSVSAVTLGWPSSTSSPDAGACAASTSSPRRTRPASRPSASTAQIAPPEEDRAAGANLLQRLLDAQVHAWPTRIRVHQPPAVDGLCPSSALTLSCWAGGSRLSTAGGGLVELQEQVGRRRRRPSGPARRPLLVGAVRGTRPDAHHRALKHIPLAPCPAPTASGSPPPVRGRRPPPGRRAGGCRRTRPPRGQLQP